MSGAVELLAATTPAQFTFEGAFVGLLNIVVAYFCRNLGKSAFIAAMALGLTVAAGAFPYPRPIRSVDTPFGSLSIPW